MATILVLLIIFVALVVIVGFFLGAGGITVLLLFGDVIIAGFLVYQIIKLIVRGKKGKN